VSLAPPTIARMGEPPRSHTSTEWVQDNRDGALRRLDLRDDGSWWLSLRGFRPFFEPPINRSDG
jgi:hypothetical protein